VLRRNVLAFFQGNRYLLHDLVAHVVEQVPRHASVVDLYAGAGLFAIGTAACRSAHVAAVEGDRVSVADLSVNAAAHDVEVRHEPVETFLAGARIAPEAFIVDPPRTGMSRDALDGMIRLRPARVITSAATSRRWRAIHGVWSRPAMPSPGPTHSISFRTRRTSKPWLCLIERSADLQVRRVLQA
jgi:hypothetical protein